jgi:hypothetical protein
MPNLHGYNPDDDYKGFGVIPAGAYDAVITDSKEKQNSPTSKDPNGSHLFLTFEIISGPQKGRKAFSNLNLNNANEQAVRISRAELKQICVACGGVRPTDSVELHNIPIVIHIEQDSNNRDVIKKYESSGPTAATVPSTAEAEDNTPPWKK